MEPTSSHPQPASRASHAAPDVTEYLRRIGFSGSLDGSVATLAKLQELHLKTVPYENLDILVGRPLSLEMEDLFDKIVHQHRGGYCFELNALFGWLLSELGYPVVHLMARFWRDEPDLPPKRRHHVLRVTAQGKDYLCDVGVGGIIPRAPIELVLGREQVQGDECYKLESDPFFGWMLCERRHGEWKRLYSFTDEPQLEKDFTMATYWCENAPDSIFRKEAMVSIHTDEGRNTVSGREFKRFTSSGVESFVAQTEAEYKEALRAHFGLTLR